MVVSSEKEKSKSERISKTDLIQRLQDESVDTDSFRERRTHKLIGTGENFAHREMKRLKEREERKNKIKNLKKRQRQIIEKSITD